MHQVGFYYIAELEYVSFFRNNLWTNGVNKLESINGSLKLHGLVFFSSFPHIYTYALDNNNTSASEVTCKLEIIIVMLSSSFVFA